MLAKDAKNYHAWQHRQWVIQTYGLFDNELNFIESLLSTDIRNNSAWNQRFFVVTSPKNSSLKPNGGGDLVLSGQVLDDEIKFVFEAILSVPGNESAWNYLRGLLDHAEEGLAADLRAKVTSFCLDLQQTKSSPYLSSLMVDLYKEAGDEESLKKAMEVRI